MAAVYAKTRPAAPVLLPFFSSNRNASIVGGWGTSEKVHLSAEGEEGRILVALNGLIDTLNGLIQGAAPWPRPPLLAGSDVRLATNRYRGVAGNCRRIKPDR